MILFRLLRGMQKTNISLLLSSDIYSYNLNTMSAENIHFVSWNSNSALHSSVNANVGIYSGLSDYIKASPRYELLYVLVCINLLIYLIAFLFLDVNNCKPDSRTTTGQYLRIKLCFLYL